MTTNERADRADEAYEAAVDLAAAEEREEAEALGVGPGDISDVLQNFCDAMATDRDLRDDFDDPEAFEGCRLQAIFDAGLLTRDTGFVVEIGNGQRFLITVQELSK